MDCCLKNVDNHWFWVYIQMLGLGLMISSDVVETVTSETETWVRFRDETETLS